MRKPKEQEFIFKQSGWIVGRKAIMRFIGCKTWSTVRALKQKGLPVRSLPNGKPMCIITELDIWIVEFNKIMKKSKK